MYGKIKGTGSYVPDRVLTNDDIAKFVETNDEWIRERTGIARRHIMTTETTKDMATEAGRRAIEASGISPEDIQMVIVCSVSSDIMLPNTACYVQAQLGIKNAMCFDLNAACTGFMVAYNTVQTYIHAGLIDTALIIGAEGLSNIMDWTDRGTCILFGDGAGAAVVQKDEKAVFQTKMHADGCGGDALTGENVFALRGRAIDEGGVNTDAAADKRSFIGMDGGAVFKFATRQVPNVINELLEDMGKTPEDIDLFLLHQANERILTLVAKRLKVSMDKIPVNLMEYGNTSSATIPILMDEVVRAGKIKEGDRIIMSGFGAGLTWAATYLEF